MKHFFDLFISWFDKTESAGPKKSTFMLFLETFDKSLHDQQLLFLFFRYSRICLVKLWEKVVNYFEGPRKKLTDFFLAIRKDNLWYFCYHLATIYMTV